MIVVLFVQALLRRLFTSERSARLAGYALVALIALIVIFAVGTFIRSCFEYAGSPSTAPALEHLEEADAAAEEAARANAAAAAERREAERLLLEREELRRDAREAVNRVNEIRNANRRPVNGRDLDRMANDYRR